MPPNEQEGEQVIRQLGKKLALELKEMFNLYEMPISVSVELDPKDDRGYYRFSIRFYFCSCWKYQDRCQKRD